MTVLITGNGHSGTTFIARLLMEVGCDFGQGDPPAAWTQGAQAMEHPEIQRAAKDVAQGCLAALTAIVALVFPRYVKAPALGWRLDEWLGAGLEVDAVIVCHRDIDQTLRSIKRAGGGYGGFGMPTTERLYAQTGRLMSAIWDHDIPHASIHFPESTIAARFLYGELRRGYLPLSCTEEDFAAAHARVARPELVHFR